MSESFEAYRDAFLSRHENAVTSVLATLGDVVFLGGLAAGIVTRRLSVGVWGGAVGLGLIVGAHFFQPGSVLPEIAAVLRHPTWALRAESQRIFGQ